MAAMLELPNDLTDEAVLFSMPSSVGAMDVLDYVGKELDESDIRIKEYPDSNQLLVVFEGQSDVEAIMAKQVVINGEKVDVCYPAEHIGRLIRVELTHSSVEDLDDQWSLLEETVGKYGKILETECRAKGDQVDNRVAVVIDRIHNKCEIPDTILCRGGVLEITNKTVYA